MDSILCSAIFVIVVVAVIVSANAQQKQVTAAFKAYQESLERLRAEPNSSGLRQRVLELGRVYSNLTRDRKGVTVYDEVALKNDIDAACAGAVSIQNRSIEDRLAKL
jgi:hypothetical protein